MPKKKRTKVRSITQEEYERYILSLQNDSPPSASPASGEEKK